MELVSGDYQRFVAKRSEYQQRDGEKPGALSKLVAKADRLLEQTPVTVIQKKRIPPSGDKHDYLSLAPYWWPDPKKADGLPYIRRDGKVDPTTRGDNVDYPAKQRLFDRVNTLGMAAFYTDDLKYVQGTIAQLEAWFVDPQTRMNPHLEYAQGVPGINAGRCFGIIEWCDIDKLIGPIELLRIEKKIPEQIDRALTRWFEEYLQWLRTSELGQMERDRLNNHGTWYDVQVVSLLLLLGRKADARGT